MGNEASNEKSGAAAQNNRSEAIDAQKIFAKCMNANGEICCKTLDEEHRIHLRQMIKGREDRRGNMKELQGEKKRIADATFEDTKMAMQFYHRDDVQRTIKSMLKR